MNTREQLNQYLRGLETRLRWLVVSKGAAIAAGVALGVTLAMVLVTNALAFSSTSMTVARVVLFIALAAAVAFALVLPLMRLNQRRAARRAERTFPEFEERLLTFVERREHADPMLDLLAEDTATVAQRTEAARVAPPKSIFAFATSAGAATAALAWLILAGPGFLGYGASLLWAGLSKGNNAAFYDIKIDPGNKLVRRKADQMVTATLIGFQAPQVKLFARYKSALKWEEAPMLPRESGSAYEFLFAAVPEPVEYYVVAAGVTSKTYRLDVVDMPAIKKVKVTYHFPSWLHLPDAVEDPGGDLRAVAGTVAELHVETDRPLRNGTIDLDDGSHISLSPDASGTVLSAKVPINKDGMYHFAAEEQGQSVRLSEDFFIEAREDNPPNVKITRPGVDARVSPIEEVPIEVTADDDFALEGMDLHYAVNGGDEKVVSLLPGKGVKQATGHTTLYLEDYKLSPGDVVAVYATARDARVTSRTDIMFIETQPYERNYTQSQQMGGGGGGDQDQNRISEREKEIIAATWNQIRGVGRDKVNAADNAKFLSEVQNKLKEQATSLAQRTRSRDLAGQNQEFQSFTKEMEAAAAEMGPASDKLKGQGWKDALEPEQRALQHLLRAESTMRDIQVAFGGGGGGGGGGAGRDLANLFDLELDTEKNQYETGQQQGSSQEQRQKQVDDALQKLQQLAQRQQELAQQEQNKQNFEQRWQQEMLRREAEELKKQMQQLQQQQQGQQSSQGQQSQSGQQGQSGSSGSSSSRSGSSGSMSGRQSDQRLQRAIDQLSQATDDMRSAQSAATQGQQGQASSQADARRAADRLKQAQDQLGGMQQQQASSQLSDLAQRSQKLADQQRDFENRLRKAYGDDFLNGGPQRFSQQSGMSRQQASQMADEKDQMTREVGQLEQDMQKAARDMAGTQPRASAGVREALSEMQQNEAQGRMKYAADNIRRGLGGYMVPREAPITQTMDKVADDLKRAQGMVDPNSGNQPGAQDPQTQRSLAEIERLRSQMQRMAGGRQNGQQGGQQAGQQAGQQGGQGTSASGGPQGGGSNGRLYGGNPGYGNRFDGPGTYYGRFAPEGMYQYPNSDAAWDPNRAMQDATRALNEMREQYKDNPDMQRQIGDLEQEISRLQVGDISSQELTNRLNRVVLPNLESLEVQLRRESDKSDGDQVRSATTDRVPAGYIDAVADYFRRLSKSK
ncbi:MAG TPA: hypothetical protein VMB85_20835 [Bryobacteraceae bacterium]|nr:hypothetical protein [Bryobacteraceae bacterium]